MSESNNEPVNITRQKARKNTAESDEEVPGIGLIATQKNSDAIASTILRANRHGYPVFVTSAEEKDNEGLTFARQLGATIVDPPQSGSKTDQEALHQRLVGAAKASDCKGLILVENPNRRIDFDTSADALNGQSVCEAIYATKSEHSQEGTGGTGVTIGIPAYNESTTIESIVTEAREFAETVLVVDDGSDDNTSELARQAGATVIEHQINKGYGAALQTIFAEADKRDVEHLAIIDADGQHDTSDIPDMVDEQQSTGADLVIGSRFVEGGNTDAPLYRRFGLGVINILTNVSMGVVRPSSTVSDTQSGFRVYNRRAISSLAETNDVGEGMNASTDILYHAHSNNFEIEEVGTTIHYDVDNASTRNPFSHGLTLVSNILKTVEKERPILVLGLPGFLSSLIGIYFGYWTISHYISTGTFPQGLALASAIFGLAGIFAVFTSIILHALNQHLGQ